MKEELCRPYGSSIRLGLCIFLNALIYGIKFSVIVQRPTINIII